MSPKRKSSKKSERDGKKKKKAPKEVEVIELSSDSESDLTGSDGDEPELEDNNNSPPTPVVAAAGAPAKRKSDEAAVDSDLPDAASSSVAGESPASKRQRKLAVRVKNQAADEEGSGEVKEAAAVAKTPKAPGTKGSHVRFGDDEPHEQFFTPLERPATNPMESLASASGKSNEPGKSEEEGEDEDEEDEEDDAPPEAVSTSAAALQNKQFAQVAERAAELQAAALRKKRQRRDVLFKSQARKRALDADDGVEAAKAGDGADAATRGGRSSRKSGSSVPALLPAEFLESNDEEDDEEEAERAARLAAERRPKKIKFETAERAVAREGRRPADKRVGSTVYRVLDQRSDDRITAPKSKYSAFQRKALLVRGRAEVRRKTGFLKK